jgi:hypothetical protein
MTAGKGGEELYQQKQAINVSYALDSYHNRVSRTSKKVVTGSYGDDGSWREILWKMYANEPNGICQGCINR